MTKEEFNKKWNGRERDEMEDEELRAFIRDCYDLYESHGFKETFDSPYEDESGHRGMRFTVVRPIPVGEKGFDTESLPIWEVRFENGDTAYCYPEEISNLEHC